MIINNFLQDEHFQEIKKLIEHPDFAWFYTGNVAHQKDTSDEYFTHTFFTKNNVNSQSINILQPLFDKLEVKALVRARALRFVKNTNLIEHEQHIDYAFSHKTAVFYVTTNNGFTRLEDGSVVNSVENRVVLFDGSLLHNSTNSTDAPRLVLTINYF